MAPSATEPDQGGRAVDNYTHQNQPEQRTAEQPARKAAPPFALQLGDPTSSQRDQYAETKDDVDQE